MFWCNQIKVDGLRFFFFWMYSVSCCRRRSRKFCYRGAIYFLFYVTELWIRKASEAVPSVLDAKSLWVECTPVAPARIPGYFRSAKWGTGEPPVVTKFFRRSLLHRLQWLKCQRNYVLVPNIHGRWLEAFLLKPVVSVAVRELLRLP